MKKRLRIVLLITLILINLASLVYAQEINLSANVDRSNISMDEQLTLSVTVKGNINNVPEPNIPPLPDFNIVSRFQSQNVEIINFQTSASITYQYILQPKKAGTFTINPITINHGGTTYKTLPITVDVSRSAGNPPTSTHPAQIPGNRITQQPHTINIPAISSMAPPSLPNGFPFMNEDVSSSIFAHASLSKKNAYVNEQVILTVSFCYPADQAVERRIFPPNNTGFLIEEIQGQRKYYATIKNQRYAIEEFRYVLYPINPGLLKVDSISINYQVQDFFGASGDIIKTEPIEIDVSSVPGGAPANFTNSVGSFKISSSVEPDRTPMDEPLTLYITVAGEGNISTLELPKLPEINNFKKFDTTDSYKINSDGSKITGEKTFKTTLIPQKTGELTIPAFSFSYFDPEKKEYLNINTLPIKVVATSPTNKTSSQAPVSQVSPGNTEKAEDIRYIKSDFTRSWNLPLYKNTSFLAIQAIPLIVIIFLTISTIRKNKLEKDKSRIKKSQAYKNFRSSLSQAEKMLKKKLFGDFHSLMYKSILDYLGDKCETSSTGLTIQQIKDLLEEKSIAREKIEELGNLLSTCDFARFSSGKVNGENCKRSLDQCIQIINMLEKKLS